ncbi:hypothetical protein ACGFRG_08035 [Streptomyces sp. NPDC048696]|uniref:hypothetical protein n=1 Tax=Streptomyces sp. NPDC048696 TaxID=3365585 RepID=UPI003717237F
MADVFNFIIEGRDRLSNVLDRAGDAAERMRRRLNASSDDSNRALTQFTRDANGRLHDLRGRFVAADAAARQMSDGVRTTYDPMAKLNDLADKSSKFTEKLKASLISLAPAAIPAAASLAPLVVQAGAGALALAAFGVALGGQIGSLGEAAKAQKKYEDSVAKSGAQSKKSITAQAEYQRQLAGMPPATQQASVALASLSRAYNNWSDSLAGDTMPTAIKSFGILEALFPRLTPLVKGTGEQTSRLMTLLGGAITTPGFDAAFNRMDNFATRTVRTAVDWVVHLSRELSTGDITGGGLGKFMAYAQRQGPAVVNTVQNIARAVAHLLEAGADVGVGMLTVVNALAKLVTAVPTSTLTNLFQLAIAIKAVRLAGAGLDVVKAALAAVGTQIGASTVAAAGATGKLAALRAAFAALSSAAKFGIIAGGLGLVALALTKLSSIGKTAPPDVDKMTTALGKLGSTGKVSGEAARVLGKDLDGLYDKVRAVTDPATVDKIQQGLVKVFSLGLADSTPTKEAKQALDAIDQALANLVKNGHADQAAAALEMLKGKYASSGRDVSDLTDHLGKYQSALDDAAFEQQLAAQSQGLFGQQAQSVQAKLDAQKASADGLRQSIAALNDTQRSGLGGMIAFEDAIDKAAEAARKNADALRMHNGQLDLDSEKARSAATALNDLAAKTDEAAAQARQSGQSWEQVNAIYDRGRDRLIAYAQQMGLNRIEARRLADQILQTPDKTARLRGNLEDLQAKLDSAKRQLARVPDSRKAAIRAQISDLEAKVREAQNAINGIRGRMIPISVYIAASSWDQNANGIPDAIESRATGGLVGFPRGGYVRGPGTSTSDSILTRLSDGEFVVRAAAVARYGVGFLDDLNAGRLGTAAATSARPVAGRSATVSGGTQQVVQITVNGALDPVAVAEQIRTMLLKLQRNLGVKGVIMR